MMLTDAEREQLTRVLDRERALNAVGESLVGFLDHLIQETPYWEKAVMREQ